MKITPEIIVRAVDTADLAITNRLPTCPLMKYVNVVFAGDTHAKISATSRVFCYYQWCLRSSIGRHTEALSFCRDAIKVSDYRMEEFCLQIARGDQKRCREIVNWTLKAFRHFYECSDEAADSSNWVRVFCTGVVRFLLDNQPDPDPLREIAIISGLPVQVRIEIHNAIAEAFNHTLGIRLKVGKNPSGPNAQWDEIIAGYA